MNIRTAFSIAVVTFGLASCGGRAPETVSDKKPSEAESSSSDRVTLSADVQRRLGIVAAPVTEAPLAVLLQVTGSVQPIDSRVTHVRPLARGRIQEVGVKVGDRVERGQELASFDNIEAGELATQYDAARAELARLRVQLGTATRQAERSRKLVDIGAIPQKESDAALSEQQQIEASVRGQEATIAGMEARLRRYGVATSPADRTATSSLRSPFAGVVTRITAAPGDVVDASSDLFAVTDISRVYVQAQVYEKDLARVRVGQPATITVDAYPDEHFSGRVAAIGDAVDPQTRTIAVRCEVDNPRRQLKLDMLAKVDLPTTTTNLALAIPSDAVQTYETKHVVFVKSGASDFVVRAVEIGRVTGSLTEIAKGLKPGEVVVTRGAFQVKSALLSKGLGEKEKG